ncbi:MAG: TolC family protein [Chlorobi bacterium]|nr:TolC family protein [Chlorobiota bacterium]
MKKSIIYLVLVILFFRFDALQAQKWSLEACIDTALVNNIQVNQEILINRQNMIGLEQARAQRIPALNANASQSFNFGRSVDPYTNQYNNQNFASNSFSFTSNYTLFNGFQNQNSIRQNEVNIRAGEKDIEAIKKNITLNVTLAYVQVLFAREQLENAQNKVISTKAQTERTEKLVKSGMLPEGNLLQLQSQLATDQYSQVNAENQVWLARVNLMQIMEIPVRTDFDIIRPEIPDTLDMTLLANGPEWVYQQALLTQPQIESASLNVKSAELGLKIAKGALFPRISLNASLSSGYSNARNLFDVTYETSAEQVGYLASDPTEIVLNDRTRMITTAKPYAFTSQVWDNLSQAVRLSLSIPILNNKQISSNIKRSAISIENARLSEKNIKNQLRKEVEQAYSDLAVASKNYVAAKKQLRSAKRSFQDTEKKYSLGLLNATDYLIEKNNFANARATLTRNKYDFLFRQKIVEFYLGKQIVLN